MRTVFAVALLFAVSIPSGVFSSTATPASYSLSRHGISALADHQFRFVTPTGVDAPTDTISIDYQGAFSFGSVGVSDIDFLHGPTTGLETNETLASSPAAGVWGVSVGTSTIVFTAPTDAAAGEITAGDIVTIRIGTNATGGTNQITNPSTAQVVQILLAGTFGDVQTVGVPIIADDSVSVTATVAASTTTPGGGGGGGGSGDTVPPNIFNVQVISITSSTASVIWNTDESSNSSLDYGMTTGYGSGTISNGSLVTSHQLDLTGLSPNTLYHFRVSSRDSASNMATAGDFVFTTLGDTTPPVLSGVMVIDITDTSARVVWQTDEPTTSRVDYGTSTAYGATLTDPGLVYSHSMVMTGLSPLTTYHLQVISTDASGNTATSTDVIFVTTGDATPPANPFQFTATGGDGVVTLTWTLPPDADLAGVRIVRRTDAFPTGPLDGSFIYAGLGTSTLDTAVTNGVTYFYAIYAFDTHQNYSSGALDSATPQAALFPENTPARCSNSVDDDGDGNIDCADTECTALPICSVSQPEQTVSACSNGIDDDIDGDIDCQDTDCKALSICTPPPTPTPENTNARCTNGADDDGDGSVDCADPDCAGVSACMLPTPQIPPEPIPQEPIPTPSGQVITILPSFYGAGGTVQLIPDELRVFGAPVGSAVLVIVPISGLGALPGTAFVTVQGSAYALSLSQDGTAYQGTFLVPSVGSYPVSVSMTFQGGGAALSNFSLLAQEGGRVVERPVLGFSDVAVPQATVTLFVQDGGWHVWNGGPFAQTNPRVTGADGGFVFVVPNGTYYVQVEKSGYGISVTSPRVVTKGVFGELVRLVVLPPKILEGITSTSTFGANAIQVAGNAVAQIIFQGERVRQFLEQPPVQEAVQQVVSPALFGVALINLASALPLFNSLAFLQYLFTQPLLLLGRRKRKKWGIVYNALTKQPVELAIVRLVDHARGLVVQTQVTDRYGRFAFLAKEGTYRIQVVKPGYAFPSQTLKGKEQDVDFVDLYFGETIDLLRSGAIVKNIPMDPVVAEEPPRRVIFKKIFRAFQSQLSLVTVIASLITLIVAPSILIACITLAQVGVYLMFKRLAAPSKAKEWGIVYDSAVGKPLERVVVRIFDKKFNKLLETQVTDANGKYGFFVRRNVYYLTAEKEGYEKYVSQDIDLSEKDEALVDQNIPLKGMGKTS